MPKTHHIIRSFNAGELSPLMDARSDQDKYKFGCRTMENFIPLIYGAAERRPGTEYVAGCISNSAKSRLVAFEHSVDDTYILEFGNQTMRVFTGGSSPSPVYIPYGTEDLSSHTSNIIAHWLCNDNDAQQTVDDETTNHDGTLAGATTTADVTTTDESGTANKAFDLAGSDYFTVADHADFTFGDGSSDSPVTFLVWCQYTSDSTVQTLFNKSKAAHNEYIIAVQTDDKLRVAWRDSSSGGQIRVDTKATISDGWHFIAVTYSGSRESSAAVGMSGDKVGTKIYIDWTQVDTEIETLSSNYTAMEDKDAAFYVGAIEDPAGNNPWEGKINNVAVLDKELTAVEIAALTGSSSTTVYSATTPYLTADLFDLKFEQSADVMYITHPSYEPRKLIRLSDVSWRLTALAIETGPFFDENADISKTIVASATTGSVTLTAVGHSPFLSSATAGHVPSGSLATSKSQTGALFKLVQATSTDHISGLLDPTGANTSATFAISEGITWDLVTNGTWGQAADSATIVLERSYDSGTTYETVVSFTSAANYNISTNGTEDFADATYRLRVTETTAGGSACAFNLSVRDTSHIGIVKITAVTSGTVATGTVLKTLGSTDKTHRWSEGTFSNYRGWPIDVTISAEERLTFTGSPSYPLTTWGSAAGDFTDFLLGTDDDDAITFTLVGTGQQNRIRWVVPKDALIIGTVGGVHLLGASKDDEALTPSNVRARLQTTKGSENVAPQIINQAVLYVERGGLKIRELLYDYESDSHKADDLTVFANHITESGIVDMAYQRTPEPILWCVRSDGEMAIMSYERDQKVYAWSRFVTTDGTSDSDYESIAVIYGGANSEDEVWVTVKRTINSSTVRYVERFKTRNWGSDDDDAFFVDCGYTYDSTSTTSITGLTWLEGETVQVYADGAKQTTKTVSSGVITLDTVASTVQVGLGYTSTLKPMKFDLHDLGRAATMKVTRGIISLYKTMRGEWGENTDRLNPLRYRKAGQTSAEFPMFTGDIEMEFQSGYNRTGDIIIRQTDPLPMTVVALTLDVDINDD